MSLKDLQMRAVFLLLCVVFFCEAHVAVVYTDLRDAQLTTNVGLGTLEHGVEVLLDPSAHDIVFLASVLQHSQTFDPRLGADYVYLDNVVVYVPVRVASAAEATLFSSLGVDGKVGVGVYSVLGLHWKCVRLSAAFARFSDDDCARCEQRTGTSGWLPCEQNLTLPQPVGTCRAAGVTVFSEPNSGFNATYEALQAAQQSDTADLTVGPWHFSGEVYAPYSVDGQKLQYVAEGPAALSVRALFAFNFYFDFRNASVCSVHLPVRTRPRFTTPVFLVALVVVVFLWMTLDKKHIARNLDSAGGIHKIQVAVAWVAAVLMLVAFMNAFFDPYLWDLLSGWQLLFLHAVEFWVVLSAITILVWAHRLPSQRGLAAPASVAFCVESGGWAACWLLQSVATRGAWTNFLEAALLVLLVLNLLRGSLATFILYASKRSRPPSVADLAVSWLSLAILLLSVTVGAYVVIYPFVHTITVTTDSMLFAPLWGLLCVSVTVVTFITLQDEVISSN